MCPLDSLTKKLADVDNLDEKTVKNRILVMKNLSNVMFITDLDGTLLPANKKLNLFIKVLLKILQTQIN